MDFGRALSFPFDDEEWPVKVILGTLLSLVPFFAQGYQVRVARNVVRGQKRPLPSADRLGEVFVDGVIMVAAAFVYFLPLLLIGCVIALPAAVSNDDFLAVCVGCCAAPGAALRHPRADARSHGHDPLRREWRLLPTIFVSAR